MKAKKAYKKGGKVPPKGRKAGTPRPPQPVLGKSREERRAETDRQYTGKPKSEMVAPRRSSIGPKRVEKMEAGGRMEPIIGRPESKKLKKLTPIGVSKITTGETMAAASDKARKIKDPSLRKTVAEVEKPRRKKRRRKFDNGGKTKKTSNVNLRGEGKKKEKPNKKGPGGDVPVRSKKDMPFVRGRSEGFSGTYRGPDGPTMEDYIRGERMTRANMEKVTPRGPDVIGLAQKVKPGTIKKSSAKIPVPAKKKRRLRRRK